MQRKEEHLSVPGLHTHQPVSSHILQDANVYGESVDTLDEALAASF